MRQKALLVAKGSKKEYDIHYEEPFGPVAKMVTIGSLICGCCLSLAIFFWMDVNNAFLNGLIMKEIHMSLPPISSSSTLCLSAAHALYGLKQALRIWFECFSNAILSIDCSVFSQWFHTVLLLYQMWLSAPSICWWYAYNKRWSRRNPASQDPSQLIVWYEGFWSFVLLLA